MYLLDTNFCSRIIGGDEAILHQVDQRRFREMATCVIVQGELLFMAYNSDRPLGNLHAILDFLNTIQIHSIDSLTTDVYGRMKTALLRRLGPRERGKRRHTTMAQLGFTDNDLWIAAIAMRHDLIVVTSDGDFARIAEVTDLRHESWLTPGRD